MSALEREVFGGSESELSDDDDDLQQQHQQNQQQQQQQPPYQYSATQSTSTSTKPRTTQPRQDYESSAGEGDSDEEEDDVYVQERPGATGKAVKKKKAGPTAAAGRKSKAGGGEAGEKVMKKRKRKQPVEVDMADLTPEQASRMRFDQRLDAILKTKKSKPRKKKNNEEVLDSFADDEVARLRENMNNAADDDIRANDAKHPAVQKLRMLPEAMETLRKASLAQSMIDNNLLEAVRRWLEPLPDRSLPALNIQRELFALIKKMEFIDTPVLKESQLGRVVLFYTKCKRVTPDVAKIANELVSVWSRPIIKRSASYRDRIVPVASLDVDADMRARAGGGGERLNAILARAKESEKGRVKRNAVMIPQRELGTYTVAPRANAGLMMNVGGNASSVDVDIERRRKNAERLKSLTRKVNVK